MKIWFDMDGTLNRFYEVDNWLTYLINGDPYPYLAAKPSINMNILARYLNKLISKGYEIGIISWLSKTSTPEYDEKVIEAKLQWLNKHLHSVNFTNIHIVSYGTNKYEVCKEGILFDDEDKNRMTWKDKSYAPDMIIDILKQLLSDEEGR